ncbi:LacI family DNA-binding transcriptional regulator [Limimaricola pyoseonensis]|uniref:Transcriptional regulator, LacI family n=1 Tax=Limimaricola pyoseonensis TaxID=521013 RepID=A0A1G7FXS6_9RHOB|nr:LacI family DNA-binding transcriptional regulator [Limimaricola pyoseonensis]SDE80602.1 transcriptional regulator, LacI family [Limimaricola pyoseonensis]
MGRRVTLAEVAARAGVSPITVSRALRRPDTVQPETRARIDAAVAALGYVPDPAARALATGRSDVIGVLIPSATNAVFTDVLSGLYEGIAESRFDVQYGITRYDPATEENLLGVFLRQRPAGLIVAGIDQTPAARRLLDRAACPVVQIMETGPDPVDMMVGFSHHDAAAEATRHLIARGYRRPGFLGARMDPRTRRRFAGFRAVAEAAGLYDPDRSETTETPSSVGRGGELLRALLARHPDTDAVFCNNDDLAMGALFEAMRLGIAVPGRLGICGFNDLEMMRAAEPPLTSVRTNRFEMGALAAKMIRARLEGRDPGPALVDLGAQVQARASTAGPAAGD